VNILLALIFSRSLGGQMKAARRRSVRLPRYCFSLTLCRALDATAIATWRVAEKMWRTERVAASPPGHRRPAACRHRRSGLQGENNVGFVKLDLGRWKRDKHQRCAVGTRSGCSRSITDISIAANTAVAIGSVIMDISWRLSRGSAGMAAAPRQTFGSIDVTALLCATRLTQIKTQAGRRGSSKAAANSLHAGV